MAKKEQLRKLHKNLVLNEKSKGQEKTLMKAVKKVVAALEKNFPGVVLHHETQWMLHEVVERLRNEFPGETFTYKFKTSSMRPDGGILSLVSKKDELCPVLISEKKNQGTNHLRMKEGKKKQAKGNAIERLGKNVIGFRTALLNEPIFPFVCFGDGCDFEEDSSILDRVITIAEFGTLNEEHLHKTGKNGVFDRGSFYFRSEEWTANEMFERCYSIAEKSVFHYFSKYGKEHFI